MEKNYILLADGSKVDFEDLDWDLDYIYNEVNDMYLDTTSWDDVDESDRGIHHATAFYHITWGIDWDRLVYQGKGTWEDKVVTVKEFVYEKE